MRTVVVAVLIGLLAADTCAQTPPAATHKPDPARRDVQPARTPTPTTAPARPTVAPARPVLRSADAILATPLPVIAFDETPFDAALDKLARLADTNVVVRWALVEAAGVARDAPVTLGLRNASFGLTLELLLQQIATDDAPLAYRASDNLIVIATAAAFADQLVTRVYDVRDLITPEPIGGSIFLGRYHDVPITTTPIVGRGVVAQRPVIETYGSGTFLRLNEDERDRQDRNRELSERTLRELIAAITGTVDPETWDVNGGPGSIRIFNGLLIVRNSPLVHQKLAHPLLNPPQP
ncbi:MAG: hypothetical protein PVJ57_09305 [Phycisphaerae bacterium]|jgi:hypothetical protein